MFIWLENVFFNHLYPGILSLFPKSLTVNDLRGSPRRNPLIVNDLRIF